jgi:hypothetical protein
MQSVPRDPTVKNHKNLKDRSKDSEELRNRLKSMRETRKTIFERIKSAKE